MKQDDKGFVFIETIIVVSFLAASLIIIYVSFTNLLTSEKRRMYYDDPIYLYRSYYILDFLQKQDVNSYVTWMLDGENNKDNDNLLIEFSCNEPSVINSTEALDFCSQIIDNQHFSVEHIYFTYYDTTPINECTNDDGDSTCETHESLNKVSANALKYIRSLGGAGKDGYRMIVEYKETIDNENRYYYSSVYLPTGDMDRVYSNVTVFDADVWTNRDKRVIVKVDESDDGIAGLYVGPGTTCAGVTYKTVDNVARTQEYYFDIGSYVACFKSNSGKVSQSNFVVTKIDKNPPICNVSDENSTWTNNSVTIKLKCTEDPNAPEERTSGCAEAQTLKNFTTGTQEKEELDYVVRDIAGNETVCNSAINNNKTFNIYHDKDKPVVSYSQNGNASYQKSHSTTVSVKTSDSNFGSPITETKYYWSTSTSTPSKESFTQSFTSGSSITKSDGNGSFYLWIYAKDSAGNETFARSDAFNFDNAGPNITFSTNGNSSAAKSASTKVTVTDSGIGNVTERRYVWSTSSTASAASGTAFNSGDTLTKSGLNGKYYLCIYAKDSLGNTTNKCSNVFAFDNTAPYISFGTDGNSGWAKSVSSTITVTNDTNGSPLNTSSFKYSFDSSNATPSTAFSSGSSYSKTSGSGIFYLKATACDQAGNCTTKTSNSFKLDNTPPAVTLGTINSSTRQVTVTVTDSTSSISTSKYCETTSNDCTPSTTMYLSTSGQKTLTLTAGNSTYPNRTLCVLGTDQAGNSTKKCSTYTTYSSPPTITLNTFSTMVAMGTDKNFVASYTWGSGGTGSVTCIDTNHSNAKLANNNLKDITTEGPHTIKCTVTSGSGSTAYKSVSVNVKKLKTIADIKALAVSSGNGVYNMSGTYRFRGGGCADWYNCSENGSQPWGTCVTEQTDVNNYIKLGDYTETFRIMEFDGTRMKIISDKTLVSNDYIFDKNGGTVFTSGTLYTYLNGTYKTNISNKLNGKANNIFTTGTFYQKSGTINIAPSITTKLSDWQTFESSKSSFTATVGLPTILQTCDYTSKSSYSYVGFYSVDSSTASVVQRSKNEEAASCAVNNWIRFGNESGSGKSKSGSYTCNEKSKILTSNVYSSSKAVFMIEEDVGYGNTNGRYGVRPVIYLNSSIRFYGTGTYKDPYVVWIYD